MSYPPPDKLIAVTFDDGPCAGTGRLLAILEEQCVQATFFLTGGHIRSFRKEAESIFMAGHELANHTDNHSRLGPSEAADGGPTPDEAAVRAAIEPVSSLIRGITGTLPPYMRAPFLSYSPALFKVASEMNLPLIDMSANSFDYNGIPATQIFDNVMAQASDGGIILLHEPYESTKAALPRLFDELRMKGYELSSVGHMAKKRGICLQGGMVYREIPLRGIAKIG
ncbi:MAG: polysaccharide deacetylase family protein [Treponema sp.]|jgi:peptidoglycan/xylan/chitin deacetylase (PgdA/CDA1 family)|nr:polysaccharide deacetylase family protein [Treponema sp.]